MEQVETVLRIAEKPLGDVKPYLPTDEDFVQRMKRLLCDLAGQAGDIKQPAPLEATLPDDWQ